MSEKPSASASPSATPLPTPRPCAWSCSKLAEEAYVRSSLPAKPDHDRAERLCMEIISRYHGVSGKFIQDN
jgi:hypothetical protein